MATGLFRPCSALNDSIQDETISTQIDRLEEVSSRIFQYVKDRPRQAAPDPEVHVLLPAHHHQAPRRPTTSMSRQGVSGENITGTMEKVERHDVQHRSRPLKSSWTACSAIEAMDISTDITVLENMMAREGLAADDLHQDRPERASDPAADRAPMAVSQLEL